MRTYVCDRCGKDVLWNTRTVLGTRKSRINIYHMIETNDEEKHYDLCKECYKEFKKFLSGKDGAE